MTTDLRREFGDQLDIHGSLTALSADIDQIKQIHDEKRDQGDISIVFNQQEKIEEIE